MTIPLSHLASKTGAFFNGINGFRLIPLRELNTHWIMDLTQQELENLTEDQYSCFLAYGDLTLCKAMEDDDLAYASYLRNYLSFDL